MIDDDNMWIAALFGILLATAFGLIVAFVVVSAVQS